MATLQERLAELVPEWRAERAKLLKDKGSNEIAKCTVAQAFGGMRGIKGMICDTSVVEPDKGLIIRGRPLLDIQELWPEQTFILMLTGKIEPLDGEMVKAFQKEMDRRSQLPQYVYDVLEAMPSDSHPMCMFNTGILVMEKESTFRAMYDKGMTKADYWIPMLDDSLDIMAKLPGLAAAIYRLRYDKGGYIDWTPGLDWGANYANMLGLNDPTGTFAELMRLYLHFHCDHEGGNVSANTCHTVGSALSDAYYSASAGLNGLAGPLHGLANQECLAWVLETMEKFGGAPTAAQIKDYAFETLRAGKVIPGYGHAVLRVTDPRYTGFNAFGKKHLSADPVFQTVNTVFEVVPKVLEEFSAERVKAGKNPIANFWPNVDAGSGALLYHYGLTEFPYYTVLFSVSRAMGMLSQLIWNRA
ncbi:MAG: citrate (Si)-synthase, partial [Deltaproteobacteria bacterium]|nr:citrate (Si)-synthase [Deltaproteobacteria bacterium]